MITKDKIRHWIFNRIGYPSDIQSLLNHIDEFENNICIYPAGAFHFSVRSADGSDLEPMIFPTPQERAAFGSGLAHGIQVMGGQAAFLTDEQIKEYDAMEKFSSIRSDPKKVN